jgi:hypothetical protein
MQEAIWIIPSRHSDETSLIDGWMDCWLVGFIDFGLNTNLI